MSDTDSINLCVYMGCVKDGSPKVDIYTDNGEPRVRVWPTGHIGPLLGMSLADWDYLVATVDAARMAAGAVA